MSDRSRVRLFVMQVLVVALLGTLFARLWTLDVSSHAKYTNLAAQNRIRDVVTPATRGQILDDTGLAFVNNKTVLMISVDRSKLARQKDGGLAVLQRLAPIVGMSLTDLRDRIRLCGPGVKPPCWNGSPYQPIPVKEFSQEQGIRALPIKEEPEMFPGVSVDPSVAVRNYPAPAGANAAHILGYLSAISSAELKQSKYKGYLGTDLIGRAGLEQTYDKWLRGVDGVQRLAVNASGNTTQVVGETPAQPGDYLVTSLNARVQAVLEHSLADAIRNAHSQGMPGDSAAGAVLDAQTGHIVAIASLPTYNPAVWVGGISQKAYATLTNPKAGIPLFDRSVQGEFAPGSTFKLITTAAVVNEGTASFSGSYNCPSVVMVGNRPYFNFEGESRGYIDLTRTIQVSCDTVYYKFAITDWYRDETLSHQHRKPLEAVPNMARAFGFGSRTGVDLPDEATGLIEDRALKLKEWQTFIKPNACAGAKRRPKSDPLQALDQENCTDGWRYRLGDEANAYIGQGTDLVTPLQLAAAYGALVNGGKVYSPRLAQAILTPGGAVAQQISCPIRRKLPVSQQLLANIRNAMYEVPHGDGTAAGAFLGFPFGQVAVGGKTGTAQVGQNNKIPDTSWFASFAGRPGRPAEYVAVVMVTKAGQGAKVAAPAVREIWDGIYGLEGHPAALAGGSLPKALPKIGPDGRVLPAQSTPVKRAPARPSTPTPSASALGIETRRGWL